MYFDPTLAKILAFGPNTQHNSPLDPKADEITAELCRPPLRPNFLCYTQNHCMSDLIKNVYCQNNPTIQKAENFKSRLFV